MPSLTSTHLSQRYQSPKTVNTDLRTITRAEAVIKWSGPSSTVTAGTVSIKSLIDTLPGGSTVWDVCQFKRFDVYGAQIGARPNISSSNWPSVTVTLENTVNSNYFGDIPTFYSDAVGNSRRAHVGITPNILFQEAWLPTTRTDTVLSIVTDAINTSGSQQTVSYEVLVQFTVALRSIAGTASESVAAGAQSSVAVRHIAPLEINDDPEFTVV